VGTTQDPGNGADRLYARSWRLTGAGRPDASALRDLVEVLVPALERLEGYRGGSMLIDRESGDLIATTFWDSLEHLEAGQARARNAAAGALVVTEGTAMQVSICDVVMSHPVPDHLAPELRGAETHG
jgi:heme-degrading monooxygenase HmoA